MKLFSKNFKKIQFYLMVNYFSLTSSTEKGRLKHIPSFLSHRSLATYPEPTSKISPFKLQLSCAIKLFKNKKNTKKSYQRNYILRFQVFKGFL